MDQKQAEIVGALVPVAVPIARTVVKERMQRKTLEEKKETQLEILEVKQDHDGADVTEALVVDDDDDSEWDDSIRRIQTEETCDLCEQLLDGVLKLSPEDRGRALTEYGRFKQIVDDTEDTEAVKDALADLPALKQAMTEEFGGQSSM